jgi:hypothetical protein
MVMTRPVVASFQTMATTETGPQGAPPTRALRGLDALNFTLADVRDGEATESSSATG